jgi:hypothetical protein
MQLFGKALLQLILMKLSVVMPEPPQPQALAELEVVLVAVRPPMALLHLLHIQLLRSVRWLAAGAEIIVALQLVEEMAVVALLVQAA